MYDRPQTAVEVGKRWSIECHPYKVTEDDVYNKAANGFVLFAMRRSVHVLQKAVDNNSQIARSPTRINA